MSKQELEQLYNLLDDYCEHLGKDRTTTLELVLKIKEIISYELY